MLRRAVFVFVAVGLAMVLTAGNAFAFFCFNASRSAKGNQKAGASQGWFSVDEILREEGLCEEGIEFVKDEFEAMGLPRDLAVNGHTVLAAPLEAKGSPLSRNGKGIDHLTEADFEHFDEVVLPAAFELCGA